MPLYSFECKKCKQPFDESLPLADFEKPVPCPECGGKTKRVITTVALNFPGDGWMTKNLRVEDHMRKKNERLTAKTEIQKREAPIATLVPNVNGEETGSWHEAKRLAASKGKDPTTYDKQIRKAERLSKKIEVST